MFKHKLQLTVFLAVMLFCFSMYFIGASAEDAPVDADFQINNGVLEKYMGSETTVEIPDGVAIVGRSAFQDAKVVKVTLPSTVTEIGTFAFYQCGELECVELQDGVESIGYAAFSGCKKLENITLPDSISEIGTSAFRSSGLTGVSLPPALTELSLSVFNGCKKLKSVKMPDQLKKIHSFAFQECYSLEKITVPEKVTYIGSQAFAHCYRLKKIVVYSDKIQKVRDHPFFFNAAGRKVVFKKKVSEKYKKKFNYQDYIRKGAVLYHKTSSSTVDMCAVQFNKKGKLTVPKKAGRYTVTGVAEAEAAVPIAGNVIGKRHKGITEVELADTITKLGRYVFEYSLFTRIKFPKNLTTVENKALLNNNLEEIRLPSKLKHIGYKAFGQEFYPKDGNTIPDKVEKLPKSIFIPESVEKIADVNFGYYQIQYPTGEDDNEATEYIKIKDYTVKGKKGSYAQKYAKKNGFKFVATNRK